MPAPKDILRLLERFDAQREAYESAKYNEAELRAEFIDPFFKALGWDVNNEQGYAEAYKDVIHEDALKIGGATEAPDSCFRIGGARKFFVECKKPSINIKDAPHPAYQLRRYGWSAKLPVSILTDFEEFAVYDCRVKPGKNDSAAVGRVMYLTCEQYAEKRDEIAAIFSREAVLKGSFDHFAEGTKGKRGTAGVDDAFLEEIERWRDLLAHNIASRNQALSQRELNFSVQCTIDRIIFLRICEDRGIEPYGRLMTLHNGERAYPRLCEFFQRADERYNSGSFLIEAFQFLLDWHRDFYVKEMEQDKVGADLRAAPNDRARRSRSTPIHQVPGGDWRLTTEERKRILLNNIFGVDIDSQAVEVTKLSLLLKVLEGESQESITKQFELFHQRALPDLGGNIKCGNSLIGSEGYKHEQLSLLPEEDRYRINVFDWEEAFPQVFGSSTPSPQPSPARGEGEDSPSPVVREGDENTSPLWGEVAARDSGRRMRGDSHGFDAIIGNPPYIRIQMMKEWAPVEVELYKTLYRTAVAGNYDIYVVFVEKAISLLNKSGRLGFILPHKFLNAEYGRALRGLIAEGRCLTGIVHFGDQQVFTGATTYTCLLFLDKAGVEECHCTKVLDLEGWRVSVMEPEIQEEAEPDSHTVREAAAVYRVRRRKSAEYIAQGVVPVRAIKAETWTFAVGRGAALFERLGRMPVKLGDIANLFVGLQTDADDVFILEEVRRQKGRVLCASKHTGREHWFESSHLKPFLKGSLNIRRYHFPDVSKLLVFPYETRDGKSVLISSDKYAERFPLTWFYLTECRPRLSARNKGRMGAEWYGYVYKKNHTRMNVPKLLVPSIATGSCFAPDLEGQYYFVGSGGGGGGGYGIALHEESKIDYYYLLGILNSSLLSVFLRTVSTPFRGGYIALNRQYIEQLPIVEPRAPIADQVCSQVKDMLALNRRHGTARTPDEKTRIERQIAATDQQIDRLVYELYGLTEDEIRIVEGGN